MLECIESKFIDAQKHDDLQWPLMTPSGARLPISESKTAARRRVARFQDDADDSDDSDQDAPDLNAYWKHIRSRYESNDLGDAATLHLPPLPQNWSVVHISVTQDKSTLFISRQRGATAAAKDGGGEPPLMFCVPLKNRRESGTGEESDGQLTFDDAIEELHTIVRLSDESTRSAITVRNGGDEEDRKKWWGDRSDLDTRMKTLLENMEFCWLGAFKVYLVIRSCLSFNHYGIDDSEPTERAHPKNTSGNRLTLREGFRT
jgi:separase